jgi:hypothetical protein
MKKVLNGITYHFGRTIVSYKRTPEEPVRVFTFDEFHYSITSYLFMKKVVRRSEISGYLGTKTDLTFLLFRATRKHVYLLPHHILQNYLLSVKFKSFSSSSIPTVIFHAHFSPFLASSFETVTPLMIASLPEIQSRSPLKKSRASKIFIRLYVLTLSVSSLKT